MSAYSEFFLNSPAAVAQLELLEISHPNFTQLYRIVRNAVEGVTVTLETGQVAEFDYYPLRIRSVGIRDDLDAGFQIDLGDLGEVLPKELDAVKAADGLGIKPVVKYRTYRSDNLSAPLVGPFNLEVSDFSFNREGSSFEAKAPSINVNQTGEIYKLSRFSGLRGFL